MVQPMASPQSPHSSLSHQTSAKTAYVTTPIYYVNDKPHIGHCYSTVLADVIARYHALLGDKTFSLTGTDEHAEKVVSSARAHNMSPLQWADLNAAEFEKAFAMMGVGYDDFMRTTQSRHTTKVAQYIRQLQESGAVYQGDYTGWFDPSQEEYLTESVAKEANYVSPVTGKPLVKRTEKNYFFKLSDYEAKLREHIEKNPSFIQPDARRNEVLGRLREGLSDVPISRAVIAGDEATSWGILMPNDPSHRIYVWIDALFNYLSAVDTPERKHFWPATVHVLAKDILWFHAVIWPAMLMALDRPLPGCIYAHAYWVRDGRKMSKSLGNFVDIDVMGRYCAKFSTDAMRYYLATQGPAGSTDSDFAHAKFVETFNAELANGVGNATSRVGNMIDKYFEGKVPDSQGVSSLSDVPGFDWPAIINQSASKVEGLVRGFDVAGVASEAIALVRKVDGYINATEPFKLAKRQDTEPGARDRLGAILYHCAEALRVASIMLLPMMPTKIDQLHKSWACQLKPGQRFADLAKYGMLIPGQALTKGEVLFMRADANDPV
jgi:methionyl-tRNA synthetase